MIAKNNHINKTKTVQEVLKIVVYFERFYGCGGAYYLYFGMTHMATYSSKNNTNRIELPLI